MVKTEKTINRAFVQAVKETRSGNKDNPNYSLF